MPILDTKGIIMSVTLNGIGALAGSATLKTRALTSIIWKAVQNPVRNRLVKRRGKEINEAYTDYNQWNREGSYQDPVTGLTIVFRETMTGAQDPNTVNHKFQVNYPVVITDVGGSQRTKLMTFIISATIHKDIELTGTHVRDCAIQFVSDYLGTLTSNEPATDGFTRILGGNQFKS